MCKVKKVFLWTKSLPHTKYSNHNNICLEWKEDELDWINSNTNVTYDAKNQQKWLPTTKTVANSKQCIP